MPPVSLKAGGAAAAPSLATASSHQQQQQRHRGRLSSGGLLGDVREVASSGGAAGCPLAELHLTAVHHRERPAAANPHRSISNSTDGAAGALEPSAAMLRVPLVAGFESSTSQQHVDLMPPHAGQPVAANTGSANFAAVVAGTDPWDGGSAGITGGQGSHARRRQEDPEELLTAAGHGSGHAGSGLLDTGEGSGLGSGLGMATGSRGVDAGAEARGRGMGDRGRAPGCMDRVVVMLRDLKEVVVYPACVCNNVGYAPIQWVFGIVTFWGPKALQDVFRCGGVGGWGFACGVWRTVSWRAPPSGLAC